MVGLVTPRISRRGPAPSRAGFQHQAVHREDRGRTRRNSADVQRRADRGCRDCDQSDAALRHRVPGVCQGTAQQLSRAGLAQLAHSAALPPQGDDDDVATQLFDMCMAEEKRMKGEVEEDEVDSDEENLYIPEDEEDDGPCAPLAPPRPPGCSHSVRAATTCRGSPPRG